MKALVRIVLILGLFLAGCSSGSTGAGALIRQNGTWKVEVTAVQSSIEPIACTACKAGGNLTLMSNYKFLAVQATLVNKSQSPQTLDIPNIGITLNTTLQDCGFLTQDNSNCLPSAVSYAGKTYAYMNSDITATIDFLSNIQIAPNAPAGEPVVFYYVIKSGAKATGFIFDGLGSISLQALNP